MKRVKNKCLEILELIPGVFNLEIYLKNERMLRLPGWHLSLLEQPQTENILTQKSSYIKLDQTCSDVLDPCLEPKDLHLGYASGRKQC